MQIGFAEDNEMVRTLTSRRSHPSLSDGIRSRRMNGCELAVSRGPDETIEACSIAAVAMQERLTGDLSMKPSGSTPERYLRPTGDLNELEASASAWYIPNDCASFDRAGNPKSRASFGTFFATGYAPSRLSLGFRISAIFNGIAGELSLAVARSVPSR
jgi:hypothetical protein